jgi:hypothetical protein
MTDPVILCTHCQVAMTSWAAPGSPIRYYQCPFCARTHASCYGEASRKGAGAGRAGLPVRAAVPDPPRQSSDDQIRWAGVKARAARWFARLEAEEVGHAPRRWDGAPSGAASTATASTRAAPVRAVPVRAAAVAAPIRQR